MDEQLKVYLDGKFGAIEKQITEARAEMERVEKSLLSEFLNWRRAADLRMHRLDNSDATNVDRLGNIEERVFAIRRMIAGCQP
jgi:hypothetical protein